MKLSYEELITAVEYLSYHSGRVSDSHSSDVRQWGLPLEIKQLLFDMTPKCEKCGQSTDGRLWRYGMEPVLCQCSVRKYLVRQREALSTYQKSAKPNWLTEIEINAFAIANTIRSTEVINRQYQ